MSMSQEQTYTIEDINKLPKGVWAELIDGQIYYQASQSKTHQDLSGELYFVIKEYIKSNKGKCKIYSAPFDIFLEDDGTEECFIPDISIICNPDIIKVRGCYGAPDWIIEITSSSTASRDYITKSYKYKKLGVHEYWIVNPKTQTITVNYYESEDFTPQTYTFNDKIKVNIYDDLVIDFGELDI